MTSRHLWNRSRRVVRAGGAAAALVFVGSAAGCSDVSDPTVDTLLPPSDGTQPVNSMTNNSAMVPGGELEPAPVGDTVVP